MKNLSVYEVKSRKLVLSSEENHTVCFGHNEETQCDEVYVCSQHNLVVTKLDENGDVRWSNEDVSKLAATNIHNAPIDLTFLPLANVLCLSLSNGELISINATGDGSNLAGYCENGLLAVQWSPDQELLVLVTKNLNTILMSCTFDPIHEVNLLNQEFGEKQFVTVGWGKKETQFHGSEGKASRVKTEVSADPNTAGDAVKITWRGDGQLYAVGFTVEGIRRFKVFDREGQLQYTSEKQQGLESNLKWRPSGNVITTTQRLPDRYDVSFFEKNGLKHGGFTIPVNTTTHVEDMAWSSDSEILALQCFDSSDGRQKILIFTTCNYHWYLKQTLCFKSEQRISQLLWDTDFDVSNNKKLHVVLKSGEIYSYTWVWNIDHSRGYNDDDNAVVAVIDGKKVLVTGFRQTIVPPPMAALELELDSFVNSVNFAPRTQDPNRVDPNTFFAFTSDQKLVFFELTNKTPLLYKATKTICLLDNDNSFPFENYNWQWTNETTIVCAQATPNDYKLLEFNIVSDKLIQRRVINVPSAVTRVHQHPIDLTKLFLQLNNGDIIEIAAGENLVPQDISFPTSCPKFAVLSIDNELHFLALSHKGNLYLDDALAMNNVSSFFIHTDFLLLTTFKHLFLSTELTNDGLNAIKEYQKNESAHVYKRKIERGAKLVIAVPNDTRTIFQLPRGNLEAIQPRPLSLKIIGKYLDNLKYFEAFDLMRKQRINLNLIYDHDPETLLANVDVFLESVKNNSWLSLFLSDLENIDVTKTMYASTYADRSSVKTDTATKIERICDVIRAHLGKRDDRDSKILPLLTSFVKKNTTVDLEHALTLIKKLKDQESGGSKLPVGSDEALKYLLYMVDVNNLFEVALGMYDFDLVLLVANKSQKDPKEFIPMLNELNGMEENFKRFTINKHLKRFDRAVEYLAKCGPGKFGELRTFVKYHSLYKKALELFSPDEDIFKQISDDFALFLKLKKQFLEAGIVFRRAKNNDKAIECFKDALEWELAIELAHTWPKEQFRELCSHLVKGLHEEKRHKEALTILEQFSENKEDVINYAIECGHYKTALRLCSLYDKENLKEDPLLPALLKDYSIIQELIETNWATFIRQRDRLLVVRQKKRETPVELYDTSYANKDSDLYSDAGSTVASSASRSSSRTYRSSKNRRKHERKVASLKEGSQYEDVALVMALHTLVTSTFELRTQVREVNVALSCCGKDKEMFILQKSLEKLLKEMKDSLKEIWTSELVLEATNAQVSAQNVPEGCSVIPQGIATLDAHLRIAPVIQEINWKLDGFD